LGGRTVLYIAHGGLGDVCFQAQWPKAWVDQGCIVDVLLMKHSGNTFHESPYVRNTFVIHKLQAWSSAKKIIEDNGYDEVFLMDSNHAGVSELKSAIMDMNNVKILEKKECPKFGKPKLYFTDKELEYIRSKGFSGKVLFHPLSSAIKSKSRNIGAELIKKCSHRIENIVVAHGGHHRCKPPEGLYDLNLFWEGFNYCDDENGTAIGKMFALVSECEVGVHGWSGSLCISVAFDKPYVVVSSEYILQSSPRSLSFNTVELYRKLMNKMKKIGCLGPSSWCITKDPSVVCEAIDFAKKGNIGIYDNGWKFL